MLYEKTGSFRENLILLCYLLDALLHKEYILYWYEKSPFKKTYEN